MIAPLLPVGDTGKVFKLLELPIYFQVGIAIFSIISITFLLMRSTKYFEGFVTILTAEVKKDKVKWANSLILFPLLISIVFISLFQFPIPHFISILATTCSPFAIMAIYGTFLGSKAELQPTSRSSGVNDTISYGLVFLTLLVIAMNRFLVMGI